MWLPCIWGLKFEEYWQECDQLSDTRYYTRYIDINICLLLDAFLNMTDLFQATA